MPRPSSPLSAKASTRCPSFALPPHPTARIMRPEVAQQPRWPNDPPAKAGGQSAANSPLRRHFMRDTPGTAFQPPTVCFRRNVVSPVAAVELRSTGSRAVTQLASSPCAINNAPRHPPGIGRGQILLLAASCLAALGASASQGLLRKPLPAQTPVVGGFRRKLRFRLSPTSPAPPDWWR